jgi:flagellar biosynthesis GTPase FlhF
VASDIFICYRFTESASHAGHLKTLLGGQFGTKHVFLAPADTAGGDNWHQTVGRRVGASVALLALIGEGWAADPRLKEPNDVVRYEISQALMRQQLVIPVRIEGAAMPAANQLPDDVVPLKLLKAMPLCTDTFDKHAQEIVNRLKEELAKRRRWSLPKWAVGLGLIAALLGGIAIDREVAPIVLSGLGIRHPRDERLYALEEHLAEVVKNAQAAQQTLLQELAQVKQDRDQELAKVKQERDEERSKLAALEERFRGLSERLEGLEGLPQQLAEAAEKVARNEAAATMRTEIARIREQVDATVKDLDHRMEDVERGVTKTPAAPEKSGE